MVVIVQDLFCGWWTYESVTVDNDAWQVNRQTARRITWFFFMISNTIAGIAFKVTRSKCTYDNIAIDQIGWLKGSK